MLRLVGFFVLAVLIASVLGHLPLVGPLFASTGVFGILLSAALLSAVVTRIGSRLYASRKLRGELAALSAVGNAYNHGKIGSLFLLHGRARAAVEHLERAVAGEPEVAEWHYRLGQARARAGDPAGAVNALERCVLLEEEHAYGAAQLLLARSLLALGRGADALSALERFERNHGPSPESAFRRGAALRALGRKDEARRALAEVPVLVRQATRYQRSASQWWALRAWFGRLA